MFVIKRKCSCKQRVTILVRAVQIALCSRHNFTRSSMLVLDPVWGKDTWCLFTSWVLWGEISSSRLANQLILEQRSEANFKTHIIKFEESTIDILEICANNYISGTSEINGTGHSYRANALYIIAAAMI